MFVCKFGDFIYSKYEKKKYRKKTLYENLMDKKKMYKEMKSKYEWLKNFHVQQNLKRDAC
jgi:hypothetical protein